MRQFRKSVHVIIACVGPSLIIIIHLSCYVGGVRQSHLIAYFGGFLHSQSDDTGIMWIDVVWKESLSDHFDFVSFTLVAN